MSEEYSLSNKAKNISPSRYAVLASEANSLREMIKEQEMKRRDREREFNVKTILPIDKNDKERQPFVEGPFKQYSKLPVRPEELDRLDSEIKNAMTISTCFD